MTKDEEEKLVNLARIARDNSSVDIIKALIDYVDYLNRYNISRVARAHRERNQNNNLRGDL